MVVRNDFAYKSLALRNVKDQVNAIMIKFEQGVSFVEKFQDDFDVDDSIPVTSMHVVKFIMWAMVFYLIYYLVVCSVSIFDFLNFWKFLCMILDNNCKIFFEKTWITKP